MGLTPETERSRVERDLRRERDWWLVVLGMSLESKKRLDEVKADAALECPPVSPVLAALRSGERDKVAALLGLSGEGPLGDLVLKAMREHYKARRLMHHANELSMAYAAGDTGLVLTTAEKIAEAVR